MFLEEHISGLKKIFPSTDFRIPFNDASSILKTIEKKFIVVRDIASALNNLSQYHSNWAPNIKNKKEICTVQLFDRSWLQSLDAAKNYWMVTSQSRYKDVKHEVFDCKPQAIAAMISATRDDFFIIDKKYEWFTYFEVSEDKERATIYSGGLSVTPFE